MHLYKKCFKSILLININILKDIDILNVQMKVLNKIFIYLFPGTFYFQWNDFQVGPTGINYNLQKFITMNTKQKLTPVAILVIYDKGFKFKYKKYFIKKGINNIGSHPSCHCQIMFDNTQLIPQRAACLNITEDLATIQALTPGAVYVLSNIKKKSNMMVDIPTGSKYVIEMEKDFLICGRKALMQISSLEQLLQIKGAVNQHMFDLTNRSFGNAQKIISSKNVEQQSFQATVPIQNQYNFEPTVQLNNTYEFYEPTQLIQQQHEQAYDPTLPLDIDLIPQSYKREQPEPQKPSISQKQSYINLKQSKKQQIPTSLPQAQFSQNSLIKQIQKKKPVQNNSQNKNPINRILSEAEVSMPSTIKQDQQMPATIKQDDYAVGSGNVVNVHNSTFPPTIQQSLQQGGRKPTNLTKSEPVYRQMKREKIEKLEMKQFHSFEDKKQPVDSFEDLFGGINNLTYSNKTVSLKSSISNQNSNGTNKKTQQIKIKQTNSDQASSKTQKVQSEIEQNDQLFSSKNKRLNRIKQEIVQQSQKDLKKCYILGKINSSDTQKLKKKGYEVISNFEGQSIDLLLIEGQLKLSKILMISLVKGLDIKPISWASNQNAKFSGKLEGFLWQHIQKRKGKGQQIFNKQKSFYLQQQLQDQYEDILKQAGANMVTELTKTRAKIKINIIIDEKSEAGKQLYEEKKNYKNWSFYRKKMIIESVLMGQEVLDKYKLDAYSF